LFDAVSDGNNIAHPKPDPEVFLSASLFLKKKPVDCLVVEDATSGIQAALSAGMDCAAMGEGAKHAMATYHLKKISDIITILKI